MKWEIQSILIYFIIDMLSLYPIQLFWVFRVHFINWINIEKFCLQYFFEKKKALLYRKSF